MAGLIGTIDDWRHHLHGEVFTDIERRVIDVHDISSLSNIKKARKESEFP